MTACFCYWEIGSIRRKAIFFYNVLDCNCEVEFYCFKTKEGLDTFFILQIWWFLF